MACLAAGVKRVLACVELMGYYEAEEYADRSHLRDHIECSIGCAITVLEHGHSTAVAPPRY